MTSERCHQIFVQFETLTNELLDLDVAEKKQHETTWRKRGEMLKKAQRNILIQLQGEIDRITGDAANGAPASAMIPHSRHAASRERV
jgi:hypothetical protein